MATVTRLVRPEDDEDEWHRHWYRRRPPIGRFEDALCEIQMAREAEYTPPPLVDWTRKPPIDGEDWLRREAQRHEEGRRRWDELEAFGAFRRRVVERLSLRMSEAEFLEVMESEAEFWKHDPKIRRLVERTAIALREPSARVLAPVFPFPAPRPS